jgi:pimeloyl-ACP methyl ester carboxylesterase
MEWRYTLVEESDLRPAAKSCTLPVFHLAGLVDPIVPTSLVRRWLQLNCPGFRESKTILTADHNVLGTTPAKAAGVVLGWVNSCRSV